MTKSEDSYERIRTFVGILPLRGISPYTHFFNFFYGNIEILSFNIDNGVVEVIDSQTKEMMVEEFPPSFIDELYKKVKQNYLGITK